MLKVNSMNASGTSQIEGKNVVFFSASFSSGEEGNYSSTKNITDKAAYKLNREQCEADYAEFDGLMMETMNQVCGI